MNEEELKFLLGKNLNGYNIVKIENDPFIKKQVNLFTDEYMIDGYGDRNVIAFRVRPSDYQIGSKIWRELVDKETNKLQRENKQLAKYKKVIKEIKDLEKYWLKGGTYITPVEVMNNIYSMIEEIESVENNE